MNLWKLIDELLDIEPELSDWIFAVLVWIAVFLSGYLFNLIVEYV